MRVVFPCMWTQIQFRALCQVTKKVIANERDFEKKKKILKKIIIKQEYNRARK